MQTVSNTRIYTASEVRNEGKLQGLKGNKLSSFVNDWLRKQQPAADAAIGELVREGFLVKSMTSSKSGMVTVKYQPPAKASQSKLTAAQKEIAELKAALARLQAKPELVEVDEREFANY